MYFKEVSCGAILLSAAIFMGCTPAEVIPRKGPLMILGRPFRTLDSGTASLGLLAKLAPNNTLQPRAMLQVSEKIFIRQFPPIEIEYHSDRVIKLSGTSDLYAVGGSIEHTKTTESKGKLVVWEITNLNDLIKTLNSKEFDDIRWNAFEDTTHRFITSVVVVYNNTQVENMKNNIKAQGSLDTLGNIDANFKLDSGSKRTLGDGTIVGYQYARFCWIFDPARKGQIADLAIDFEGAPDMKCLPGATSDPSDFKKIK